MKLNAKQVAEVLAGYEDMIRVRILDELVGVPTHSLRDSEGHLRLFVRLDAVRGLIDAGKYGGT